LNPAFEREVKDKAREGMGSCSARLEAKLKLKDPSADKCADCGSEEAPPAFALLPL